MGTTEKTTRDGSRYTTRARLALATLGAFTIACLATALTKDPTPPFVPPPGSTSDLDVFRKVVNRVHAGEGFHDASHAELLRHGYPTRSVFNYRTPLYCWCFGAMPSPDWGRLLLCVAALATLGLCCRDLIRDTPVVAAGIGGVFLVGAMSWCVGPNTFLFTELWAGMFIMLSMALYRRERVRGAVVAGLLALLVRELALPYVLVCLAIALAKRRRRELIGWGFGLAAITVFMAWHAWQVALRVTPSDPGMTAGWVRFGGIRFILATTQANVFLMGLPLWCTALYVPVAALGLATWRGEAGLRAGMTASLFLAGYSVVGAPFNFYWGFIDGPILAVGIAHGLPALARLIGTAFRKESPRESTGCVATPASVRHPGPRAGFAHLREAR